MAQKVFRPVVISSAPSSFSAPTPGGFRFSAWVSTGYVSVHKHHDGRRMIEEHETLRPDDGSWVDSLAEAKEIMARDIETKANGLYAQAHAIRAEAQLDRAREAEATGEAA